MLYVGTHHDGTRIGGAGGWETRAPRGAHGGAADAPTAKSAATHAVGGAADAVRIVGARGNGIQGPVGC